MNNEEKKRTESGIMFSKVLKEKKKSETREAVFESLGASEQEAVIFVSYEF